MSDRSRSRGAASMNSSNEWARPRLPEYIATKASPRPSDFRSAFDAAGDRVDLLAAAPDGDRPDPIGRDPLERHAVGHVRAEHDHAIGLPIDEAAEPAQPADHRVARRHPPERQAGIGVQVHAPVDVPRSLEPLQERADQPDDRRRRERHDGVEPGQGHRLDHGAGVEAQVVGHPGQRPATAQRRRAHPVDVHALVDLVGGRIRARRAGSGPGRRARGTRTRARPSIRPGRRGAAPSRHDRASNTG